METLQIVAEFAKTLMDTFGSALIVPLVVFVITLILGVDIKKASRAALYMAIGLTAFGIILGVLVGQVGGAINQMVANTGVQLNILDIGWPAAASIVYSNNLGMLYLIVGVVFQIILFVIGVTDTFQPTDIWNYYYFVVWAIMVEFVTGSFLLALFAALFMNLFVLLVADIIAPGLQEYYGYEGLTVTCIDVVQVAFPAVILNAIFRKIKFNPKKVDAQQLQERFGFWGEPVSIGLILGAFIGILANISQITTLAGWSSIFKTALTLAVVMVLYPTVSGMFVKGLVPVSNHMSKKLRESSLKRKIVNIGIDPAIYFGETNTLTTGLVLIPILILTAIILPGANIMPLADLTSMPFMAIGMIAVFRGDIVKSLLCGTIWYSLAHYIATDTAALFTDMSIMAGVETGDSLIHSWCIAAQPPLYIIFKAFSASSNIRIFTIVGIFAVYLIAILHFKRNRKKWYMAFGATEEFVDNLLVVAKEVGA